jgi:nitrogen fixation-related uncharacterized protein
MVSPMDGNYLLFFIPLALLLVFVPTVLFFLYKSGQRFF